MLIFHFTHFKDENRPTYSKHFFQLTDGKSEVGGVFYSKTHAFSLYYGKIRCPIIWDKHSRLPRNIYYTRHSLLFLYKALLMIKSFCQSSTNLKSPAPTQ